MRVLPMTRENSALAGCRQMSTSSTRSQVTTKSAGFVREELYAVSDERGFFTVSRLRSGSYSLIVMGHREIIDRRPVVVEGADVTDVQIVARSPIPSQPIPRPRR